MASILNKQMTVSGQDLIDAGMMQGAWFAQALPAANDALLDGESFEAAIAVARGFTPPPPTPVRALGELDFHVNLDATNDAEADNKAKVEASMARLMQTPVVKAGAVMPDACPAGPEGTIPVGGIVTSEAIHPGMHSADICCSVAISVFDAANPAKVLDAIHQSTHFGPGGRPRGQQIQPSDAVMEMFHQNDLLRNQSSKAIEHFATQGDGNHFAFVGTLKSTGQVALVTHHGSRAPGALLYKAGMQIAEQHRRMVCPDALTTNAWIEADTAEGDLYWDALQTIRAWTKENHFALHDMTAERLGSQRKVVDRFWNEHNFVFRKSDGLFYHGKGATPAFNGWASDATDLTLIPLNMREPILIARGKNARHGLGFSPHGAGRNFSRSQHKRMLADRTDAEIFAEETKGIDARFFCGDIDISELPSAYKDAWTVREQIDRFDLADVVDEVMPYGSIMAGDWQKTAPWKRKKRRRS